MARADADTLLLSAGKADSPLPDHRFILFIQLFNEFTGLGAGGSPAYCRCVHHTPFSQLYIFADCVGKEENILHDKRDIASQLF